MSDEQPGWTWKQMLSGAAVISGATVAAVVWGGPSIVAALGEESALGGAIDTASAKLIDAGGTVAKAIGLEKLSAETATAAAGIGAALLGLVGLSASSGAKQPEENAELPGTPAPANPKGYGNGGRSGS